MRLRKGKKKPKDVAGAPFPPAVEHHDGPPDRPHHDVPSADVGEASPAKTRPDTEDDTEEEST